MAVFRVKSLEDLAFKALFEEIFSYLELGHQNVDNADKGPAAVISLKQKVENIRDKLDEFLVSIFSEVRKKLIVEFLNGKLRKKLYQFSSEVGLTFFDSILDGSFKSLDASSDEIAIGFPDLNKLLEILSARSPELELVKVHSHHHGLMTQKLGGNCVQLLKNLSHLTSLSMEWATPYDCLNFFSQLV